MRHIVNSRNFVSFKDAFSLPFLKKLSGSRIGVGLLVKIQTNEIVGRLAVKFLLLFL